MATQNPIICTAFSGFRRLASGPLAQVVVAAKAAIDAGATEPVTIYEDATGRLVEVDTRGSLADVTARLTSAPQGPDTRGPGRPRLGVVAREVTLLPRHWEWLNGQPGGASVALRKLVEEARRTHSAADRRREEQGAAYRFIASIAGDLPNFEESARALFADDAARFAQVIAAWPPDLAAHAIRLAFGDRSGDSAPP